MAEKRFFVGERVIAEQEQDYPECPAQIIVGKIIGVYKNSKGHSYDLEGDDGEIYNLGLASRHRGLRVEKLPGKPTTDTDKMPEFVGARYHLKRLNPEELREDFPSVLEQELSLIKQLAQETNETQRAATLASARNLTRYLSSEIDAAYREAERLAQESDETGKAMTLATLRNLNAKLKERQSMEKK